MADWTVAGVWACERPVEEYVEIFDGIKDENTLNKFDRYMMDSLRTVFPKA